jgi:hypothetical protein
VLVAILQALDSMISTDTGFVAQVRRRVSCLLILFPGSSHDFSNLYFQLTLLGVGGAGHRQPVINCGYVSLRKGQGHCPKGYGEVECE